MGLFDRINCCSKKQSQPVNGNEAKCAKAVEAGEEGLDANRTAGRGQWASPTEFMLTCVGYSVGLGNVWRFPYLCYISGGGAFLIPYVIMMLLIGMPLLYMEYSFGQYFGIGSLSIFKKVCPMFQGIGIGYVILNALVCIYYNVIIAISLYYLFGSFTANLPWGSCGHEWNDDRCSELIAMPDCNQTAVNTTVNGTLVDGAYSVAQNISALCANMTTGNTTGPLESPSDQYFRYALLNERPEHNIENLGEIRWHLCLCLLLAWILVVIFVSRGIQSTGKVAYFTATFPYVMLTVLVVRGATLTGAAEGIKYFVQPDFDKLKSPDVWYRAAVQLFYSTNLAWGGMITMASYNDFRHNCFRDAIVINCVSFFTSLYAGFAVFSIIGFMANEAGVEISEVIKSGPGLAFIAYPRALSLMPLAPMWSALFFFMLFLLGVGSQMVLIETVVTSFVDEFPRLGLNKLVRFLTTVTVAVTMLLCGIPMTTQGGMYVLNLMDHYSAGFCVLVIAITECIVINWIYGNHKFACNVKEMLDKLPALWWRIGWRFISPILILGILIFNFVRYQPARYNENYSYPMWADGLGWCLTLASVIPIFIVAFYKMHQAEGSTLKEKWLYAIKPIVDGGDKGVKSGMGDIPEVTELNPGSEIMPEPSEKADEVENKTPLLHTRNKSTENSVV